MKRGCFAVPAALLLSGCALVNKAEPLDVTYYDPAFPEANRAVTPTTADVIELRLDRVTSAEHLDSRIAYRENSVQIGFYDEQRWAERPEAYLRRALARALFTGRGVVQALGGARPALEAELVAFEEVRSKRGRRARASIQFVLRQGPRVLANDLITVERPVTDDSGAALARALGAALDDASSEVATRAVKTLRESLAQAPPEGTP